MNYADIRKLDISNGPGIRSSLFVSGCNFKCNGCFNQEAQDFKYGKLFTKEIEDKFIEYTKSSKITGVNILGGEPLQQDNSLLNLLKRIKKETNKNIWLWTGYKLEEIPKEKLEILEYIDVLVDGRFELNNKNLSLKYRGSGNQKVNFKNTEGIFESVDI